MAQGGELWVQGADRKALTRVTGRLQGDRFRFPGAPPSGRGELHAPGHVPAQVEWEAHRCERVALVPAAPIVGSVVGAEGDEVRVMGCGTQTQVGPDGSFFLEVAPERCALRAVRTEGLGGSGPWVEVHPRVDHDTVVDLLLPPPVGGIGIRFLLDDDGQAVIEGVFPGSPADQAGVRPAQRIVAVDGELVREEDLRDLARRIVGPVGTAVTLTLQTADGTREVTLTRAAPEP